jgi:peptidoglycan/LPS O-acetylase OafA/YrhL
LYASLVIFLATGWRRHVPLGRYGDISYGVYLFHFPIIQTFVHLRVYDAHPYAGAVLALALTLAAAWLSWHLVEKRMLRRSASPLAATVTQ